MQNKWEITGYHELRFVTEQFTFFTIGFYNRLLLNN